MKKVLAILLVIVYASISSVEAVSLHFCHDKLVDFSLHQPVKSCCGDSDIIENHCCRNITIKVDIDDDQLVYNNNIEQKVFLLDLFQLEDQNISFNKAENLTFTCRPVNKPPGEIYYATYLLNHSFLFYS